MSETKEYIAYNKSKTEYFFPGLRLKPGDKIKVSSDKLIDVIKNYKSDIELIDIDKIPEHIDFTGKNTDNILESADIEEKQFKKNPKK